MLSSSSLSGSEKALVIAGTRYGSSRAFTAALSDRDLAFALEITPSTDVSPLELKPSWGEAGTFTAVSTLLADARWREVQITHPTTCVAMTYLLADLGTAVLHSGASGRLVVIQTGQLKVIHRGTVFALVSGTDMPLDSLVLYIAWVRWIRPVVRKQERAARVPSVPDQPAVPDDHEPPQHEDRLAQRSTPTVELSHRPSITISRQQDEALLGEQAALCDTRLLVGRLASDTAQLNVVELFAGAGGMGLGFLLAEHPSRQYRVIFSAEVHPIYVRTLSENHHAFVMQDPEKRAHRVPEEVEPTNLWNKDVLADVKQRCQDAGGLHILIGGPPCQGFSSANRNSGHSANPNNGLVDVFLKYVDELRPPVFLMENVQGILWMPKGGNAPDQVKVLDHLVEWADRAGYLLFPKVLDAAWHGVPQHRNRFFLLGIDKELGYASEDFGTWGPFPWPTHGPGRQPYVTVEEAIGDLPKIGNGHGQAKTPYTALDSAELAQNPFLHQMRTGAPGEVILDHITSRHAQYVLEHFEHIPEGGNWENIKGRLTNYSDISRTHSNMYRRLQWKEPSITIGHYRKSMLVHPDRDQNRGLSLREAARLQSFPDWFIFSGTEDGSEGGLMHKQQQLANAVCPLVTKAIAEFILRL